MTLSPADAPTELETRQIYDPNTPRTEHAGLTATMFGEILRDAPTVLNVAAGDTDLQRDLRIKGIDTPQVTSIDPMYADPEQRPLERDGTPKPGFITGYAQDMPFEDGKFAMTICQFGAQHMPKNTVGQAMHEMVRVTQMADGPNDSTKGAVLINPVFRPKKLEKYLRKQGVSDVAGITDHDTDGVPPADRISINPTLWIQKTDALTPERLDAVIRAVSESGALEPSVRTLGELASRAVGGKSKL